MYLHVMAMIMTMYLHVYVSLRFAGEWGTTLRKRGYM